MSNNNNSNELDIEHLLDVKRSVINYRDVDIVTGFSINYVKYRTEVFEDYSDVFNSISNEDLEKLGAFLNISAFNKKVETKVKIGGISLNVGGVAKLFKITKAVKSTNAETLTMAKLSRVLFPEYISFMKNAPANIFNHVVQFSGSFKEVLGIPNGYLAVNLEERNEWLSKCEAWERTWKNNNKDETRFSEKARAYFGSSTSGYFEI